MNLPFDALPGADYIRALSSDTLPQRIRDAQACLGVPSLGEMGCRFLSLCASMKQPAYVIDIGCGIGASTMAIHLGSPNSKITAVDANKERVNTCAELMSNVSNITVKHSFIMDYLANSDERYDMAFIDSVKKSYPAIWDALRPKLNPGAVVLFDDVLLYGYTAECEATVPLKYRDGRRELRLFLEEISADNTLHSQIIPLDGGLLLVKIK